MDDDVPFTDQVAESPPNSSSTDKKKKKKKTSKITEFFFSRFKDSDGESDGEKEKEKEKKEKEGEKEKKAEMEEPLISTMEVTAEAAESVSSLKDSGLDDEEERYSEREIDVPDFSGGGYVQADSELDQDIKNIVDNSKDVTEKRSEYAEKRLTHFTNRHELDSVSVEDKNLDDEIEKNLDLKNDDDKIPEDKDLDQLISHKELDHKELDHKKLDHKRSSSGGDFEGYDSSNSQLGKDSADNSDRTSGYSTSIMSGVSYHGGSGFVSTPQEVCVIRRTRDMNNSSLSDMDDEVLNDHFDKDDGRPSEENIQEELEDNTPLNVPLLVHQVTQNDIEDYEAYNEMMAAKKQGLRQRSGTNSSDGSIYRTSSEQNLSLKKHKKSPMSGSVQDISRMPGAKSEGLDDLRLRDDSRENLGSRDTLNATAAVASAADDDYDTMSITSTTSIGSRIKKGWKGKKNWFMKGFNKEKTSPTKEVHHLPGDHVEQEHHKYFKKNQKSGEASKKLKTQIWSSVVTIVLVEGKDLLPMDDNGYSDPYVKFRLGNEKFKSKYKAKTLNPSWLEQFDLHMFDEQTSHLEISVWDHDTAGKDDIMGRAVIDLGTLAREETHALEQPLEDGAGIIKMMLTISGTCGAESVSDLTNYIPNPRERENVIRKYGLANSFKNIRDVGWLQVKVIKAQNLIAADIGGKSDPFCVLELVNDRLQTQTEYKTLNPEWGKVFTFNVKDIHAVLEVTVYDEDRDKKAEFLGKVAIPILRIQSGERRWFALKDKKLCMRAKGSIMLELDFVYNHVKAAVRTVNPREEKYMQPEPKFKISIMKRNIDRVSKIADAAVESGKFIQSCFDWESKARSITAFIVFLIIVWNFELYMLPITLLIVFFKNLLVVHIVGNLMKDKDEDEYVDEEDDEDEEEKEKPKQKQKEEKKSFKERLQAVQEVCLQVQEGMDMVASMGERVKNTANWTVPWLSWLAVTIFFIGTFVLFYVPVRFLILAWGINKFTKKLRAPNAIPNNELLDYLSRVPSDKELMMYRELRPDPGIGTTKRKRTST